MASGFSFQNLSITKKIHAITCIAVVAFIIMVLINFLAIDDNRASLDEMGNSSYKVVKLTSANVGLLEKLDELYTQAVTFGEQDLITKADDTYKTIESNINLIKQMSNGYISNDVAKELADYEKISATIANGMVNGTADFSKIQQQAQLKTSLIIAFIYGDLDCEKHWLISKRCCK